MPRTLSPGAIAALSSGNVRFVVLVRIQAPGITIRMTSDTDDTVFNGETYSPGTLGNISSVSESNDITEGGISITMSGVDLPTLAVVAGAGFISSAVDVWLLAIDNDTGTGGDLLLFSGFTSRAPNIAYGNNPAITVSCQGKFDALNRPRTERYADADQQRKYPGDLGMQYAAQIASKEVIWPAASWFNNQG